MATYNGKKDNLKFTCGECGDCTSIEIDLDNIKHKDDLWKWLHTHSADGGKYENILITPKYFIYVCPSCKGQLSSEIMGKKCTHCGQWTYSHECQIEVEPNLK